MKSSLTLALFCVAAAPLSAQGPPRQLAHEPIRVQRKCALVIGNQSYPQAPLRNPVHDAAAIARTLRTLHFDSVIEKQDLSLRQMRVEIDRFAGSLEPGDLALFYYAGHGVQANQHNYLIPIDFASASEADLPYDAYPAQQVRDLLEDSGSRLRIIILDACRNNPFRAKRGGRRGLAPMDSPAEGTYIAFATGDNDVADDNPAGSNGLFTEHLLAALRTPGLDLKQIFERTKEEVYRDSERKQRPFTYDGVIGSFTFTVSPTEGTAPEVKTAPETDRAAELAYWNSIKDEKDPRFFQSYLTKYPNGTFVDIAELRLRASAGWEAVRDSKDPKLLQQFIDEFPESQYARAARMKIAVLGPAPATPVPASPAQPRTGEVRNDQDVRANRKDGQRYVWIAGGTFRMGCSQGDTECSDDENPPHSVTITKGFWIGQTLVTQEAYQKVMGDNRSHFKGAELPVEKVSWDQARDYCEKVGGRLPTEAEWEYAARAGSNSARYGDLAAVAWYAGNSGDKTHPVATKQPNAFTLYDMLGNVQEWVSDRYGAHYYGASVSDPSGPLEGKNRVLRGGSYSKSQRALRVSKRGKDGPGDQDNDFGFRCVGESLEF